MGDFRRTLLLTRWAPDARYAGGEYLRKRIGVLPKEALRWAYVARPMRTPDAGMPVSRAFPPRQLHWRLRGGTLQHLCLNLLQAPGLARRIAAWAAELRPELVWIISDMEAVTVGRRVARRLRVPIHLSVPDAYESCRLLGVPRSYYAIYVREVRRALAIARSVDTISEELLVHLRAHFPMPRLLDGMVFPSPAARAAQQKPRLDRAPLADNRLRRIGFCGASRVSDAQWHGFLRMLGRLEWDFEIMVFADPDFFNATKPPGNVNLAFQPYQASEEDVVRRFVEMGVRACYLGLWREPEKALFARTSLSSKLTTYVAAALPIVVDAPEQSVAWRLVRDYGAGVLVGASETEDIGRLKALFGDRDVWWSMAQGSARLCRAEFDLESKTERFVALLNSVATVA